MSNRDTLAYYLDMMESLDPDSAESLKQLIDDPINNINNATMANWTKSVMPIAIQSGNSIIVSQVKSMHNEALNKIEFDNVTDEITALYNCAYEFKKAEMDLEAIANISDEKIKDEPLKKIESHLDNFTSSMETAVTRTFGMLSSAAKNLKNKIIPKLKESAKELVKTYAPNLKKQFFDSYNKTVELFFRLLNEFVSKVFSFVEMIKGIGKSKGFGLKSVTISFEPPTFSKIDVFGFPIPIPQVSLPKVDINFEMEMRLENGATDNPNNSIINKESNEVQISTNSYEYDRDIIKFENNDSGDQSSIKGNINKNILNLLLEGKFDEFNDIRQQDNFTQLYLSNANLSNTNLFGANLFYVNLSNANLSYSYLPFANLSNANLSFANLSNANLSFANLSNANLSNAYLVDSIIIKPKIYDNLIVNEETNFTDAIIVDQKFNDYIMQFTRKVPTLIKRKKDLKNKLEGRKYSQTYIDTLLTLSKLND